MRCSLFIVILLALESCRTPVGGRGKAPAGMQVYAAQVMENLPPAPVAGVILKVFSLSSEEIALGSLALLKITAVSDKNADYTELVICEQDNRENCKPTEAKPLKSAAGVFYLYELPAQDVALRARACAHPDNSLDPDVPCGDWLEDHYIPLAPLLNSEDTRKLFAAIAAEDGKIQEECEKIRVGLKTYLNAANPETNPELYDSVLTQLNLTTPQLCAEFMQSGSLEEVEQAIAQERSAPDTQAKEGDDLAVVNYPLIGLALGVPSVLVGLSVSAHGYWKLRQTQMQVTGLKAQIRQIEDEKARILLEQAGKEQVVGDLEAQRTATEAEAGELQEAKDRIVGETGRLQRQLDAERVATERVSYRTEVAERLEASISQKTSEIEDLDARLQANKATNEFLLKRLKREKQNLASLGISNEAANRQIAAYQEKMQVISTRERLETVTAKVEAQKLEKGRIEASFKAGERGMVESQRQLESLRLKNTELDAQIARRTQLEMGTRSIRPLLANVNEEMFSVIYYRDPASKHPDPRFQRNEVWQRLKDQLSRKLRKNFGDFELEEQIRQFSGLPVLDRIKYFNEAYALLEKHITMGTEYKGAWGIRGDAEWYSQRKPYGDEIDELTRVKELAGESRLLRDKAASFSQRLVEGRGELKQLPTEDIMRQEIGVNRAEIGRIEERLRVLGSQGEALRQQLEAENSRLSSMEGTVKGLQQRVEVLRDIDLDGATRLNVVDKLKALDKAKEGISAKRELTENRIKQLQGEQARVEQEVRELSGQDAIKKEDLARATQNRGLWDQQLKAAREELERLKTQAADARTEIDRLNGEKSLTENKLAAKRSAIGDLTGKGKIASGELEGLRGQVRQHDTSISDLQGRSKATQSTGSSYKLQMLGGVLLISMGALAAVVTQYSLVEDSPETALMQTLGKSVGTIKESRNNIANHAEQLQTSRDRR